MLVKGNQSIRRFIEVREDNFMTLKHFKKSEFTCKCGCNRLAVDIKCTDSKSRAIIMDALVAFDFERFGISKDFIHTDIDGEKSTPRIWVY